MNVIIRALLTQDLLLYVHKQEINVNIDHFPSQVMNLRKKIEDIVIK